MYRGQKVAISTQTTYVSVALISPSPRERRLSDVVHLWISGVNVIWELDKLSDENVGFLDEHYCHRQHALKSVDDMVEQVVRKLEQKGLLNNICMIYSCDNGYHMGQHRLQGGKKQCFEEDIGVPLIIRGPGIVKGQSRSNFVFGHVDIAPTIINMMG